MTSQINPADIDATYPIAGVSNNTQGMRDNFTYTQTNFQYAADEITDLQNKVVLKAALTGTTLDNNFGNNVVYNALVKGISGTVVAIANTSGAITLDASAGPLQSIVMANNISLGFVANTWPIAGTAGKVRLQVTGSSGQTITLPSAVNNGLTGVQGISGNVITLAATGTYQFDFSTTDGGATITFFDLNRPLNYYTNPVTIASTTVSSSSGSGALIVSGGVGIAGNLYVSGNIVGSVVATGNTFVGNTTVGNLLTSGFVSATANVTGGNVLTGGIVSAAGNITGGNLNATGLSLSGNVVSAINLTANITTTANIQAGNLKSSGIMSATANVTGGNILTGGLISATSTITSTANITGGNILTGGLISSTGNITGGNVLGGANVNATTHTGTTASLSGNITGGNVLSAAVVSAVGAATILSGTVVPAGGTTGAGYKMSSTTNLGIFFGTGAPTLSAAQGSLYLRTDGSSTTTRMYINTNGSTTWTNVVTSA
jgi:hypothetical protein